MSVVKADVAIEAATYESIPILAEATSVVALFTMNLLGVHFACILDSQGRGMQQTSRRVGRESPLDLKRAISRGTPVCYSTVDHHSGTALNHADF